MRRTSRIEERSRTLDGDAVLNNEVPIYVLCECSCKGHERSELISSACCESRIAGTQAAMLQVPRAFPMSLFEVSSAFVYLGYRHSPNANHFTRSLVLSLVSLSFCSLNLKYSISFTTSLTVSSILLNSVSTGFSFSAAWIADQSRASAPISMSSSTWR
jgi:hypothetical protein